INLIVAITARQVDRTFSTTPHDAASSTAGMDAQAPVGFVLTASGIVGFAFFLMELVWYRMLGPLLVGIGVGGLLYSLLGADRPATIGSFALTCLLEAVAIAAAFALGDRLATLA